MAIGQRVRVAVAAAAASALRPPPRPPRRPRSRPPPPHGPARSAAFRPAVSPLRGFALLRVAPRCALGARTAPPASSRRPAQSRRRARPLPPQWRAHGARPESSRPSLTLRVRSRTRSRLGTLARRARRNRFARRGSWRRVRARAGELSKRGEELRDGLGGALSSSAGGTSMTRCRTTWFRLFIQCALCNQSHTWRRPSTRCSKRRIYARHAPRCLHAHAAAPLTARPRRCARAQSRARGTC